MESTYGDLLSKSAKAHPSNSDISDPVSKKLHQTYKQTDVIDLSENEPLHNIIYNLNATPKPQPKKLPPRQITFDTMLKNNTIPLVSLLSTTEKQRPRVLPDSFMKKNPFKQDTEEKSLKSFVQWKDSIIKESDLPHKRKNKDDTPDILKKNKKSVSQQNAEILKAHSHSTFDASEFIRMQEKQKLEEKKREEALKKAREKNLEQKKYEETMKNFQAKDVASELDIKQKLALEKERRKVFKDSTQEFFSHLLSIDLYKNASDYQLHKIETSFANGAEYIKSFIPAFFEEVRAEVISAVNQNNMSKYWEINVGIFNSKSENHYLEFEDSEKNEKFSTNIRMEDLILMISDSSPQPETFNSSFSAWGIKPKYILGFVEKDTNSKRIVFRVLLKDLENLYEKKSENHRIQMKVFIIDSCTTIFREFKMIRLSEFVSLSDYVYSPSKDLFVDSLKKYKKISNVIEKNYNPSQAKAIVGACKIIKGIYLLQGPPGTGKTHTIRGILSALYMKNKGKVRILVCAPSNSAIDEIANRVVTEKLLDLNNCGVSTVPMVRIVSSKNSFFDLREKKQDEEREMPEAVKPICLNNLVSCEAEAPQLAQELTDTKYTKKDLDIIDNSIREYEKNRSDPENARLIKELKQQKYEKTQVMYKQKHSNMQTLDKIRHLEQSIIKRANIVFCTLSGAGGKELDYKDCNFDYTIVDEACQSVELSNLIPFKFDSNVVILVGDPNQLPATTFSQLSSQNNYSRSLFERLMYGKSKVHMLEYQYRMLPEICAFPSSYFYNSRLLTDQSILHKKRPDWIKSQGLLFINLLNSRESRNATETSISNTAECEFVGKIFAHFKHIHGRKLNIGIITPYKKQVRIIKEYLQRFNRDTWKIDVEVNTIDGFQGKEKDLVIFSAVRTGETVGFLADQRRLNVAITRAKYALWIVASRPCLYRNQCWRALIDYVESKNRLLNCNNFNEIADYFTPDFAQPMEIVEEKKPEISPIILTENVKPKSEIKQVKPKESHKPKDTSKLALDIISRSK